MKTLKFHVEGMHCKSCTLVIESELADLSYVETARADARKGVVTVTGDFENVPQEALAKDFSTLLSPRGYKFSVEKTENSAGAKKWSDFKIAIPLALAFAVLFFLLQKIGLINLVGAGKVSYGTAFIVGIVASLSSCMAVVGGLLLSMSATFAKSGSRTKPQFLFHAGRLISFFIRFVQVIFRGAAMLIVIILGVIFVAFYVSLPFLILFAILKQLF